MIEVYRLFIEEFSPNSSDVFWKNSLLETEVFIIFFFYLLSLTSFIDIFFKYLKHSSLQVDFGYDICKNQIVPVTMFLTVLNNILFCILRAEQVGRLNTYNIIEGLAKSYIVYLCIFYQANLEND